MTAAHNALGDADYERLKAEGRAMSINELVDLVVSESMDDPGRLGRPPPASGRFGA